jgi:hypothetical protein
MRGFDDYSDWESEDALHMVFTILRIDYESEDECNSVHVMVHTFIHIIVRVIVHIHL